MNNGGGGLRPPLCKLKGGPLKNKGGPCSTMCTTLRKLVNNQGFVQQNKANCNTAQIDNHDFICPIKFAMIAEMWQELGRDLPSEFLKSVLFSTFNI